MERLNKAIQAFVVAVALGLALLVAVSHVGGCSSPRVERAVDRTVNAAETWIDEHRDAVTSLRDAALRVLLEILKAAGSALLKGSTPDVEQPAGSGPGLF